jgi:hypothetical protein
VVLPGDRSCVVRSDAEVVPWECKREWVLEEEKVWERTEDHAVGEKEGGLVVGSMDD